MNDRRPTIMGANILFLVCVFLLLSLSVVPLPLSLGVRVTINELFFILAPVAAFLLIMRLPARETLSLKLVSWPILAASFVTGIGFVLLNRWLVITGTELVGYVPAYTPELLETDALGAVLMAFGLVILAPLFEEAMFRGVLASAYSRWGATAAVVIPALLFALFHMDPMQTLFIVPLALALGWVAWRTGSLWASVAMHAGNNFLPGLYVLLGEFVPGFALPADTIITAGVGLLVALAGVVVLHRMMPRRRVEVAPEDRRLWLLKLWPLGVAVPLTVGLVLLTLLIGMFPELLSLGMRVNLDEAPWETTQTWQYEILNPVDEPVGEATCTLTPGEASIELTCDVEQEAFEVSEGRSYWNADPIDQQMHIVWDAETLNIDEGQITGIRYDGAPFEVRLESVSDGLRLTVVEDGTQVAEETLPADAVLAGRSPLAAGDWPWRYMAMPFVVTQARQTTTVRPGDSLEVSDLHVIVRTADIFPVSGQGDITWRVTVGERFTAWYAVDEPHTLVGYTDDMVTWVLVEE